MKLNVALLLVSATFAIAKPGAQRLPRDNGGGRKLAGPSGNAASAGQFGDAPLADSLTDDAPNVQVKSQGWCIDYAKDADDAMCSEWCWTFRFTWYEAYPCCCS